MTTPPLLCDTGALLDYLNVTSPDHAAFRRAIDSARTRYIPGLVLVEVDYFLRHERDAMATLVEDLSTGAFTYVPPTLPMIRRAMEIDAQYRELGLGLVDASVVALAEFVRVRRIATRDVRDFTTVRLRDGKAFELVVVPSAPDQSRS